jgi:stage II sporulation protein D
MKKIIIVSLALAIFALAFSIFVSAADPLPAGQELEPPGASPTEEPPASSAGPTYHPDAAFADDRIDVRVLKDGEILTMTLGQYLIGVVSAEMPATFETEALKAQAVAARTETLYHMLLSTSSSHPNAHVCTDSTCCQAYKSDVELQEKWGGKFSEYISKITAAVRDTDGEYIDYGGQPIQAVFHSSSAGRTEESSAVWQESLPYLVSVDSPESEANVPDYISTVTVSAKDFKETVVSHYPNAVFSEDKSTWVTDITYTDSGRIATLKLGGITVTGPSLRSMFGLRSTAASIEVGEEDVTFKTTGYGHGVGMSQYGANTLALEGKGYRDILSWYYTGVSYGEESSFFE